MQKPLANSCGVWQAAHHTGSAFSQAMHNVSVSTARKALQLLQKTFLWHRLQKRNMWVSCWPAPDPHIMHSCPCEYQQALQSLAEPLLNIGAQALHQEKIAP